MANQNMTQQDLAKREEELRQQAETAARLARGQSVDPRVAQGLSMLAQTNPQEYQRLMADAGRESTKAGVLADVTQQQQKDEKRVQQQIDQYERQIKNAESLIGQPGFDIDRGELEKAKTNLATIKSDFAQQQADYRDFVSARLMPFVQVEMVTKRRSTDGGRSYYEDKAPQLKVNLKGAIEMGVPDQDLKKIGVSQLDIVRAKKDIRAEENARKVDAIARPIEREREAKAAEQSAAFKRVEKYYNQETKQFSVTKASSEGIPWETVKQAGFDISKADYESSKLSITRPEKTIGYEKAEAAFDKTAEKIFSRKDINEDEKVSLAMESPEWQRLQAATAIQNENATSKLAKSNMAMNIIEWTVPVVYTVRHWDDMSAVEKSLSIATDVAAFLPFVGAAVRASRGAATLGQRAMLKAVGKALATEAIGQTVAPVQMIIHPVQTVKAIGKQALNLAENVGDLRKIPYTVLTTTDGTVRIRIDDKFSPAQAMAARDALMKKAIAGERLVIQAGDNVIEMATSPFMREARKAGGAVTHATPGGEVFEDILEAAVKKGKPLSEQGIFFSHEPLPKFSQQAAFGGVEASRPTIYIASRETAEQMVSSNKIYRNTAELESVLPVGAKTAGPQQRLYTRIGANADKVQILLEKPLSKAQIARLKAEGIIEAAKAPFSPAIKVKGAGVQGLSRVQVDDLARVLRTSGNADQARSLVRIFALTSGSRVPRTTDTRTSRLLSASPVMRDIPAADIRRAARELDTNYQPPRVEGRADTTIKGRPVIDAPRIDRINGKPGATIKGREIVDSREAERVDVKRATEKGRATARVDSTETPIVRTGKPADDTPVRISEYPEKPERSRVPPDEPDEPGRPTMPPSKPPVKTFSSPVMQKEARKKVREAQLALGWRQGQLHGKDRYDVILNPFEPDEEYLIIMGRRPQGLKLLRGPRSAYNTAQTITGKVGKAGTVDIPGIMSAKIWPSGDKKVSLKFTRDADISTGKKVFPLERKAVK